ncbi:MAG: hydrolase, partial [Gammaproteobacteria bacterium]
MKSRVLAAVLILLIAGCSPVDDSVAIRNVTLIDALHGVRENQTVVFQGDEILAVHPADTADEAATVIDGTGKFLIPGLWDFHVHLTYDPRLTEAMPELFLSWGITSVRDTGALLANILPVVERMRAEGAVAPRVFFAGPLLDGQFVVYNGDGRPEIGVQVASPEDARNMVRALYDAGVDFIKVYEMVTPEVFYALVEAAGALGLPIDSHVPLSMRASVAGPFVDSIEHLRNIEMDCVSDGVESLLIRRQALANRDNMPGAALRSSLHNLQRLSSVAAYDQLRCDETIAAMADTTMVPTLRLNSFNLTPSYLNDDWEQALSRLPQDVRDELAEQGIDRAQSPSGPT